MKKLGVILLVCILCVGTIFATVQEDVAFFAGSQQGGQQGDEPAVSRIMTQATTFEEIKLALKDTGAFDNYRKYNFFNFGYAVDDAEVMMDANASMDVGGDMAMPEESVNTSASGAEDGGSKEFSSTNVQIEGIDEADIIKTDGDYLYIVGGRIVYIVKIDENDMEIVSKIDKTQELIDIHSIFIDEDRLVVFGTEYPPYEGVPETINGIMIDAGRFYSGSIYQKAFTFAEVYDLQDKANPEVIQELTIEGDFRTARKSGDLVYLAATKYIHVAKDYEDAEAKDILPMYYDSEREEEPVTINGVEVSMETDAATVNAAGKDMEVMAPADICICPIDNSATFTTIAVLDIAGDKEAKLTSYLGSLNQFYMNQNSIFMTYYNWDYESGKESVDIIALDVDGMDVSYRAEGNVEGTLLNQFSMDEYNGYFRIATTEWEDGSNVFVLDENLQMVGKIENIAEGEQIYSVRFMGDRGYIVTFETMDPFFTVDLSDPTNPVICGELKLPGYSNYLHQIDENTVLGIGRQTQEIYTRDENGVETVVGFQNGGIKLSLFDISDFANPVELDSYIIGNDATWSDALYDHKSIMVDMKNGKVGFCIYNYNNDPDAQGAYIFDVSGDEITEDGMMPSENADDDWLYGESAFYFSRICYAGDTYYFLENGMINAYDRESYEKTGSLEVK